MRSARMFNDTDPARSRAIETALCSSPTRRGLLGGLVAALFSRLFVFASPSYAQTPTTSEGRTMTQTSASQPGSNQAVDKTAIRPFQVNAVSDADLADLRRRINATRWPDREYVSDDTQGVQLATAQKLARYWGTAYDWHKCEARLKALPHFITEIDGLDIHFIHVRSKHENALPLIVTHGWPGSIIEQLKIIDPVHNSRLRPCVLR